MKKGEIYFNREVDFLTGKPTKYVKMGIVQEERRSEDRKKEHQTGNPREITIQTRIIDTPNAKGLESSLHNRFNFRRIHGEWFVLTDEEIEFVKSFGEELKQEQIENLPYYESMKQAADKLSNGQTREATVQELRLASRATELSAQIVILEANKSIIRSQLIQSIPPDITEIPGILTIDQSRGSESFDKKRFMEENPELATTHQKVVDAKTSKTYIADYKISLKKADETLNELVKELPKENHQNRILDLITERTSEFEELHAKYLEYDRQLEFLNWEFQMIETEIKASIDDYFKITGVASWKRIISEETTDLDTDAIKALHPEVYKRYLVVSAPKWSVNISPFRAYPIKIEPIELKYPKFTHE
jgi:hypothetical protein